MGIRKKIYNVLEGHGGLWSILYDYFTMLVIVASILPLFFKQEYFAFMILDFICVGIFIFDYLLRWITADFKYGKRGVLSFLRYPISFMALIDLISILPSVTVLHQGFKLLRLPRLLRAFRVFRVFKAFRFSKSLRIITGVLKNSRTALASVGTLAIGYVIVSALVVFNIEPETFDTFFDAFYWATISLTTVGYGDIYAVSTVGKVVTMISSLIGIAIVALPSSIITAGYMRAVMEKTASGKKQAAGKAQSASGALLTPNGVPVSSEVPLSSEVLLSSEKPLSSEQPLSSEEPAPDTSAPPDKAESFNE